jgi:putative FmdB family regulatory protein
MPIYEYTCTQCAHQFEEIILGREAKVPCPQCGSEQTQKLMSRCRSKLGGGEAIGAAAPASSGSCAGCSGGSCATCG